MRGICTPHHLDVADETALRARYHVVHGGAAYHPHATLRRGERDGPIRRPASTCGSATPQRGTAAPLMAEASAVRIVGAGSPKWTVAAEGKISLAREESSVIYRAAPAGRTVMAEPSIQRFRGVPRCVTVRVTTHGHSRMLKGAQK